MLKIGIDLSGRDSAYLSNTRRYLNGLGGLALYKGAPADIAYEPLKQHVDLFEQYYEAATNRDRVQIRMRKKTRKDLTEMFEKIKYFLQAVAEEDDIPALVQAGFEVKAAPARRRPVVAPVGG